MHTARESTPPQPIEEFFSARWAVHVEYRKYSSAFVQFRGKVDRNDNYERLLIMTCRERLISRVDENKAVVSPPASWRYRSYAKRIDEIECEGIRLMCERYSIKTTLMENWRHTSNTSVEK
jgi:hypothetical protein